MIERRERSIPLGFNKDNSTIVNIIEQTAEEMLKEGWRFVRSYTDPDFREISLFFEREIEIGG